MRCPECERIKSLIYKNSNLYFHFPIDNTFSKFAMFLGTQNYDYESDKQSIMVKLGEDQIENFLLRAYEHLEENEIAHTQVMIVDADGDDGTFQTKDFYKIVTLKELQGYVEGRWLIDILEKRSFTSHFQPIFQNNGKDVFGYEALFRGKNSQGEIIPPDKMFGLATDANLLFQLDLAARCSAVDGAAEKKLGDQKLFINFNPSSIYDPSYCLKETTSYIADKGIEPSQIIFEVVESHKVENSKHLRGILSFYRKAGFDVALDDVGSGYSSLNLMRDLKPSYVKVDMGLIRNIHQDDYRQNIVQNLIDMTHANQGKVICEGIETEDEYNWLVENNADLLQGFYLAKPSQDLFNLAS